MCSSNAFRSVVKVATFGLAGSLLKSAAKPPEPPKVPEAAVPEPVPTEVDPGVSAARESERRRRLAAAGQQSTILTGPEGLTTQAQTGQKTLLGA